MNELGFLVIGAQKSGTTTLYKHLRAHPGIYLPKEKELAFFAIDERYESGIGWLIKEYFSDADPAKLWGDVSPQYMAGLFVAERIAKQLPDAKLVAILRNPIDRAYSAYRMQERRGKERRKFTEIVREANRPEQQSIAVNEFIENDYIKNSMYGVILGHYFEYFPREHIHVVFMEDMESDPERTISGIYRFLDVDTHFVPESLGKKYHEGGAVRWHLLSLLLNLGRKVVAMLPAPIRRQLRGKAYWLNQWNIQPEQKEQISLSDRQRLVKVFQEDTLRLEKVIGRRVPWGDFHSGDS